jgi:hypothetical protein
MKPQDLAMVGQSAPMPDVDKQHMPGMINTQCLSNARHAIVMAGRTQAADTLHLGRVPGQSDTPTQQETRSRGCPRAQKPFLPFARLPSWQPAAQKKPKQSISKIRLFRQSRLTPANTSKIWGRAQGAYRAMPALFLIPPVFSHTAMVGGAA